MENMIHKSGIRLSGLFHLLIIGQFLFLYTSCVSTTMPDYVDSIAVKTNKVPLFLNESRDPAFIVSVVVKNHDEEQEFISKIKLSVERPDLLSEVKLVKDNSSGESNIRPDSCMLKLTSSITIINCNLPLNEGENTIYIYLIPSEEADLSDKVNVSVFGIFGSSGWKHAPFDRVESNIYIFLRN